MDKLGWIIVIILGVAGCIWPVEFLGCMVGVIGIGVIFEQFS
jgi:hypothetical protein